MLFTIWAVALIAALVLYIRQVFTWFSRHGVKNIRPLPFIGNLLPLLTRSLHFVDDIMMLYQRFPGEKFVGRYEMSRPMVVVRDLDLIRNITTKDFEHFLDHRSFISDKVEPIVARNLFALKGQEWKDMRSTLSPAFTSSKIKLMVPFMDEVGKQMLRSLEKNIDASGVDYIDVEVKDLTTRYANDVIASCAFGLKVDSHSDENNIFYRMGKEATTFRFIQVFKFLAFMFCPGIMRRLKVTLFSKELKSFFTNLVLDTMANREANNIIRHDMIHLLMQAKKGKLSHNETAKEESRDAGFAVVGESSVGKKDVTRVWSDEDLIAQAVLFFLAGFETISSTMTFALYELAVHPDIQERLVQEIRKHHDENNGKFDFNSIQYMSYLDMVVSEVLRRWPPAIALDRICTKDYNLGKPNSTAKQDYIVRKGDSLTIPTWAILHDEEYFPDPYKFDPERFSEQNAHQINPIAYMPFGLGPRNCIGSRFALCELKVLLYQILLNMELSPCEKTTIPPVLSKGTLNVQLQGGHWVRFRVRK